MAKELHWKCSKAQAPRVRVPCPLPEKTKGRAKARPFVFYWYMELLGTRTLGGRDRRETAR